jgi:hypothetical protein
MPPAVFTTASAAPLSSFLPIRRRRSPVERGPELEPGEGPPTLPLDQPSAVDGSGWGCSGLGLSGSGCGLPSRLPSFLLPALNSRLLAGLLGLLFSGSLGGLVVVGGLLSPRRGDIVGDLAYLVGGVIGWHRRRVVRGALGHPVPRHPDRVLAALVGAVALPGHPTRRAGGLGDVTRGARPDDLDPTSCGHGFDPEGIARFP